MLALVPQAVGALVVEVIHGVTVLFSVALAAASAAAGAAAQSEDDEYDDQPDHAEIAGVVIVGVVEETNKP